VANLSFLTDLELAEVVLSDIVAFADGKEVTASPTIAGTKYNVSLVVLANGPAAPFQPFQGSIFTEFIMGIQIGTEIAAGVGANVALKIGNTWYGLTIVMATPPTVSSIK
jgi:hypothetical protein